MDPSTSERLGFARVYLGEKSYITVQYHTQMSIEDFMKRLAQIITNKKLVLPMPLERYVLHRYACTIVV
jgi:hypothetical protein